MKKTLLLSLVVFTLIGVSCNSQPASKATVASGVGNIDVYYFHNTARCMTCKTIEAEAQKNIETLYADQLKTGKLHFSSLNLEEAEGKAIAEKLGVAGQTLLIVQGDLKINITNEGFLYAVNNPDKLREIMKEKIDPLVN